jgi:uncharacterized protein YgiM (DUF1202 family)
MKKIVFAVVLCAAFTAAVFGQASKGGTMYVATKTLALKSGTGFFASTRGKLEYGTQVTVLQINGKNAEVRSVGGTVVTGWTATANLSAKRIVTGATANASANEVALAGKGFNEEVENAYKSGGKLNYADVDIAELQQVPTQELYDFIVEGHLSLGDK